LQLAGAEIVDPIVIPQLNELMNGDAAEGMDSTEVYFSRNPNAPFKTREELLKSPDYSKVRRGPMTRQPGSAPANRRYMNSDSSAREKLLINIMKVMADNKLDAIVHKSVEHSPTLIKDGINPPYTNMKGAPRLNTFLVYASSISVPAGFTPEGLPVGITFFGKPYSEPTIIKLAYAYEQATLHRIPPKTVPPLEQQMTTSASLR
jgi:Asp-tRNA(Asn)/Glu-tRNA(Gln) amidotransferase A subunit family amidase